MNHDMQLYYNYTTSPLGNIFYKTLWRQLEYVKGKTILDFGSGFAFTSNFLAKNNTVTALEINQTMIAQSANHTPRNNYTQLCGDISAVCAMPGETFDFITCHLVLEFVENPESILSELMRVLKKGGTLSIVKHNKTGRIIQAAVQEHNIADAHNLLDGGFSYSSAFGNIKYYTADDLLRLTNHTLTTEKTYGIRALASLHSANAQNSEGWFDEMFALEHRLLELPEFINIAYFHHILLKK